MTTSEPITKRLHISGITPSITPLHIKDRFNSFGTVKEVEELNLDALGQPRPFTYLTIETTALQLRKCLNIMSGSMWRGAQLRLAEAKPRFEVRLDAERNPKPEALELALKKKRKRFMQRRGDGVGKEAQDMRLATEQNYTSKRFWKITPENHILRPIAMRPTHPLPPSSVTTTKTSTIVRRRPRAPPSRSRRRVLNPMDWNPSHQADFEASEGQALDDGWEYESVDEDAEDDIIGFWRRYQNGEVEEEVVRGKRRRTEMEDDEFLELIGGGAASPLFGQVDLGADSPLFGNSALPREPQASRADSPLFSARAVAEDSSPTVTSEATQREDSPLFASRPVQETSPISETTLSPTDSPLFPSRALSSLSPYRSPSESPSSTAPPAITSHADPLRELAETERTRALGLLGSLLGESIAPETKKMGRGEWAGFTEDSDSEDDIELARAAGTPLEDAPAGAAEEMVAAEGDAGSDNTAETESSKESFSEEGSSDADEKMDVDETPEDTKGDDGEEESGDTDEGDDGEGSSEENSDEESEEEESEDEDSSDESSDEEEEEDTAKPGDSRPSTLKDMFAPQASKTGGFSLLNNLDIELDDDFDMPLAPAPAPFAPVDELDLEVLAPTAQAVFDANPEIPLFFPIGAKLTGARGEARNVMAEDGQPEGFFRQETDEKMKERWDQNKLELTREYKKRHRDAVKQRRRRGGEEME